MPAASRNRRAPSSGAAACGSSTYRLRSRYASSGRAKRCDAGRQLLDPPVGDACEIRRCSLERFERDATRLVRERHRHVDACGQRLDQRPLGAREILEAVGVDGRAVPGAEVTRGAVGAVAPLAVAVPHAETVELGAVRGVERAQVAADLVGLDETGLELAQRRRERVGKAREPGRAAERPGPTLRQRAGERGATAAHPCSTSRLSPFPAASREKTPSNVSIDPAQQRSALGEQLALHAVDVARGSGRSARDRARDPRGNARGAERLSPRSQDPRAASAARDPV